jgi:excisionase family DNA binding protein
MSDLTDVKFFLASLIRPIVREAIRDELASLPNLTSTVPSDEVLTVQQAAEFLDLTTQTVYGLVSDRKIPFSKPTGSRLYFSRLDLVDWLKSKKTITIQEQTIQYDHKKSASQQRKGGRKTL